MTTQQQKNDLIKVYRYDSLIGKESFLKLNLYFKWFLLIAFLICFSNSIAQSIQVNIPPSSVTPGTCQESPYQAVFTIPANLLPSHKITINSNIVQTSGNPIDLCNLGTSAVHMYDVFILPSGNSVQALNGDWEIDQLPNTATVCTLFYKLRIDCNVYEAGEITQTWSNDFPGNPSSPLFTINTSNSNLFQIPDTEPLHFTNLSPLVTVSGFYLDEVFAHSSVSQDYLEFKCDFSPSGSIIFEIENIYSSTCLNSYEVVEFLYQKDFTAPNGPWLTYSGPTTLPISQYESIFVKQKIKLKDCTHEYCNDAQDPNKIKFSYKCDFTTSAPQCTECIANSINNVTECLLYFTQPFPVENRISVNRITPDFISANQDFTCQNDFTQWEFEVKNSGNGPNFGAAYQAEIIFNYSGNIQIENLSLIGKNNVSLDAMGLSLYKIVYVPGLESEFYNDPSNDVLIPDLASCSDCFEMVPANEFSCSDAFIGNNQPFNKLRFAIRNFKKNEVCTLTVDILRCCDENEDLFNLPKFYNFWGFGLSHAKSICDLDDQGDNTFPVNLQNSSLGSGGSISPNGYYGGAPNLDLVTQFQPVVSDLTDYDDTVLPGGDAGLFTIYLKSLFPNPDVPEYDNQLLGCQNTLANCTTNGLLKVEVRLDQGLFIENPSKVELRTLKSTGTIFPKYYSDILLPLACTTNVYTYYFDLDNVNLEEMFKYGAFNFTLTSCCYTPLDFSKYKVLFSIAMDPNNCLTYNNNPVIDCQDCCFLPLSMEEDEIAVHCPGCMAPGIIPSAYRMERRTFGYQDTDNNGIADASPTIFDNNSSYRNDPIRAPFINVNTSMHGDSIVDFLLSRFEPGVNYTYTHTSTINPTFIDGGKLNWLQLKRTIPHSSVSEMNLTIDFIRIYIDEATGTGSCIDCDQFNLAPTYHTKRILEIPGSALTFPYFDRDNDTYLFSFDAPFLNNSSFIVPNFPAFNFDFREGQKYRIYVRYNVCGNITTNDETAILESEIQNKMWLCGVRVDINDNSIDQMPTLPPLPPTYLDQDFADGYLFFCETTGRKHYFISNWTETVLYDINDALPDCKKSITYENISGIGPYSELQDNNIDYFLFEIREPRFQPKQIQIDVPNGFTQFVPNSIVYSSTTYSLDPFNIISSSSSPITVSPTALTYTLYTGVELPNSTCIDENNYQNPGTNILTGDQLTKYRLTFELDPEDCSNLTLQANSFRINQNDHNNQVCASSHISHSLACDSLSSNSSLPLIDIFHAQQPNLVMATGLSGSTIEGSNNLCWDIILSNFPSSGAENIAPFVFLALDPSIVNSVNNPLGYLSNISIMYNNNTYFLNPGEYIFQLPNINHNASLNIKFCADYVVCQNNIDPLSPTTFMLSYGWNCSAYPLNLAQVANSCQVVQFPLKFYDFQAILAPGSKTADNMYSNCEEFQVSLQFSSTQLGGVKPLMLDILTLPDGLSIVEVSINSIVIPQTANPALGHFQYNLLPVMSNLFNNGYMQNSEMFTIQVIYVANCMLENTIQLPNLNVIYQKYCGDIITIPYDCGTINQNYNLCDDCFTVEKIRSQPFALPFENINYTLHVCNTGSGNGTTPIFLTDILPDNFIVTNPIPCLFCGTSNIPPTVPLQLNIPNGQCHDEIIYGYYDGIVECEDDYNTAIVNFNSPLLTTLNDKECMDINCVDGSDLILSISTNLSTSSDVINYYGTSLISNKIFYVEGNFIVGENIEFLDCILYMAPGSQIIVNGGFTITLNNSDAIGCIQMWQGIYLNPDWSSANIINGSRISDANWGIYANNQTSFRVISSDITECIRGIYVPPATPGFTNNVVHQVEDSRFGMFNSTQLKSHYLFQPPYGNRPFAGIDLYDCIVTIGSNASGPNYFEDLNIGFMVHRSKKAVVQNSYFNKIFIDPTYQNSFDGTAIVSLGTLLSNNPIASSLIVKPGNLTQSTIDYGHRGIYTRFSYLDITNVDMTGLKVGIFSGQSARNLTTLVKNCKINASFRGIDWLNNDGALSMLAINNEITMSGNKLGIGINMFESNLGNIANYKIKNNEDIIVSSAMAGISMTGVNNAIITHNKILQTFNSNNPFTTGISINAGGGSIIDCNMVICDLALTTSVGLAVNQSPNNQITCNTFNSNVDGVQFGGGQCGGTIFTRNNMLNNTTCLYLNNQAVIDPQVHAGNIFSNYSGTDGAVNTNYPNEFLSLFMVHTNMFTVYYPSLNSANFTNGWFGYDPTGNPLECIGNVVYCGEPSVIQENHEYERMIASDSIETVVYNEESKNLAQEYLFEKLSGDSSLLLSDTVYTTFFLKMDTTVIGELYKVKQQLSLSSMSNNFYSILINIADSLIISKSDSILLMDSLYFVNPFPNYEFNRQEIINRLDVLSMTKQNLIVQQNDTFSSQYFESEIKNTAIIPAQLPEANTKYMNDIYIKYMLGDKDSIFANYPTILSIAEQCPFSGGPSVYRARTFVYLFNDSIEYDDQAICLQNGIYKQQNSSNYVNNLIEDLRIIPNPANNFVKIILRTLDEGLCKIEISNILGENVIIDEMHCQDKSKEIDTSKLNPGVYFIKVNKSKSNFKRTKLIISH